MSVVIDNKRITYDVNEITSNYKYKGTYEELRDGKISVYLNVLDLTTEENVGSSSYRYDDEGRASFNTTIAEDQQVVVIGEVLQILDDIKSRINK